MARHDKPKKDAPARSMSHPSARTPGGITPQDGPGRPGDEMNREDERLEGATRSQADGADETPDDDDETPEGWSRGEESFEGNAQQVDAAGGNI